MQFKIPIWINPPAKVKHIKIIEQIVTNMHDVNAIDPDDFDESIYDPFGCLGGRLAQCIVTPGNFRIGVGTDGIANNEIILLTKHGVADPTLSWRSLFEAYGNLQDNETRIRLKLDDDIENFDSDILGTVAYDDSRPNILTFTVDEDTLPSTIPAIDAIVDPHKKLPGKELPASAPGQRYLLVSDLTNGEEAATPDAANSPWGIIRANENDIIEYDGTRWFVSFNSQTENTDQYVVNLSSLNHYKFTDDGWVFTYLGEYFPGYWRVENLATSTDNGDPLDQSPSDQC
jgi:hypothetical protein